MSSGQHSAGAAPSAVEASAIEGRKQPAAQARNRVRPASHSARNWGGTARVFNMAAARDAQACRSSLAGLELGRDASRSFVGSVWRRNSGPGNVWRRWRHAHPKGTRRRCGGMQAQEGMRGARPLGPPCSASQACESSRPASARTASVMVVRPWKATSERLSERRILEAMARAGGALGGAPQRGAVPRFQADEQLGERSRHRPGAQIGLRRAAPGTACQRSRSHRRSRRRRADAGTLGTRAERLSGGHGRSKAQGWLDRGQGPPPWVMVRSKTRAGSPAAGRPLGAGEGSSCGGLHRHS